MRSSIEEIVYHEMRKHENAKIGRYDFTPPQQPPRFYYPRAGTGHLDHSPRICTRLDG